MTSDDIVVVRQAISYLEKILRLDADGNGQNLHDIKNSFDYVAKYIDEQGLTDTVWGEELTARAKSVGNVISELWNALNAAKKNLESTCDR